MAVVQLDSVNVFRRGSGVTGAYFRCLFRALCVDNCQKYSRARKVGPVVVIERVRPGFERILNISDSITKSI